MKMNKMASIAIMIGGVLINATALVGRLSRKVFEWRPEYC